MKARARRRFFWRVYLYGLLLIALVALMTGASERLFERIGPTTPMQRWFEYFASHVDEARADQQRLTRELDWLLEAFHAEITLYENGVAVASNVTPPLPRLNSADERHLAIHHNLPKGENSFAAALPHEPFAYLVFKRRNPPLLVISRIGSLLTAILIALAIASIPLARAIVAPVERLRRAAVALGQGDFSARTGLRRKDEVGELAIVFDDMAERIERIMVSEKLLIANISHELRTPLARVRVALDLLAEEELGATEMVRGIAGDLSELEALVDDVLTMAKLDLAANRSGGAELPLRLASVDLHELIQAIAVRFRADHPARALIIESSSPLPLVLADAALLRRVIENLIDNARKYSDDGTSIVVRLATQREGVTLTVEDRGIGIDAEDLPRLFRPFFRTDRSQSHSVRGVGLGLVLARRVVEAHGGNISAASVAGAGTAFHVWLPAEV
jgi:signal transduction histidine kinase